MMMKVTTCLRITRAVTVARNAASIQTPVPVYWANESARQTPANTPVNSDHKGKMESSLLKDLGTHTQVHVRSIYEPRKNIFPEANNHTRASGK